MKNILFLLLLIFAPLLLFGQETTDWKKPALLITPEILVGSTAPSNDNFPETGLHKQLLVTIGRNHQNNPQEWAQRLKGVRTGIGFGISDFGNLDSLGIALTVIPQIQFNAFGSERFSVTTGMGASYFTKNYDSITNPNNRAVTTDYTWAFRLFLNYNFLKTQSLDWNIGAGYSHHSNGHTKLDNQGYNSFLVSLSAAINNPFKISEENVTLPKKTFERSHYSYFSLRGGLGWNVLALAFNDNREVYSLSAEYGKVYNNTWKVGLGLNYRFYEHYYDYIEGNESLVQDGREFEDYKEHPVWNSSAISLALNGEVLLNHVGIAFQVGYNFHKPAYKIDWRINEGWDNTPREIPESWMLGEFGTKFKLKHRISSRLGAKYYFIGTEKRPLHNIFIGAHLNANLGQADFSEVGFGYVYSFGG
ncbi:MAG: acyloxyacyl hydrolase [Patiriisocius sp.]|uniref:acyloxyacyl hydrolase n=1 Tax=Patiriisocius sp. TaxID=2822396 RepID=UPI003EF2837B